MIPALIGLLGVCVILLSSEVLWRKKRLRGERARKFVHIAVGSFVASWSFFMSFTVIQLISVAMLAVIVVSRYLKIFKGIHSVKRRTAGDIFYPISIGLVAALAMNEWIFVAAILHLSLADGLAAVVGDRYGKKNRYKVFKEIKSVAGSLAFWAVSTVVIAGVLVLDASGSDSVAWPVLLWLPPLAALLENISPSGADNLIVPFVVMSTLNWLHTTGAAFIVAI